ncbi:hypothetical protein [Pseudofrankia sp. DC12]|uniref:hypothetical protein n=1 Tax=Pseudofrankia sp. DC12 TaxID=683315 RepID=UPI001E4A2FCE|nr:hypothetical protein [Pseudofrankia sp. DC12]
MATAAWDRFPLITCNEHARRWLQFTANIGRAPNTVDAYGRAVEDHLRFCDSHGLGTANAFIALTDVHDSGGCTAPVATPPTATNAPTSSPTGRRRVRIERDLGFAHSHNDAPAVLDAVGVAGETVHG